MNRRSFIKMFSGALLGTTLALGTPTPRKIDNVAIAPDPHKRENDTRLEDKMIQQMIEEIAGAEDRRIFAELKMVATAIK